jgi:hypothetical protein
MLSDYKNSKDFNQSSQTFGPIILSKTPSIKTMSTQISLEPKKRTTPNISLNKPKSPVKPKLKLIRQKKIQV